MKRVLGTILITLLLAGCGEPKIDASTPDKMKSSIDKVRDALPKYKRGQFDDALEVAAMSQLTLKELMQAGASDDNSVLQRKVGAVLDGKTGEQVIAYAKTVKEERAKKEKDEELKELKVLDAKVAEASSNYDKLKAFKVIEANFHMESSPNKPNEPIITMNVENDTSHVVFSADFVCMITSPASKAPLLSDFLTHPFPSGLKPGEKAKWVQKPGPNSKWAQINNLPKDAQVIFFPTTLIDEHGKSIFGSLITSEKDRKRLAQLKAKYQPEAK